MSLAKLLSVTEKAICSQICFFLLFFFSGIEFNCWPRTHESHLFSGCCLHEATGFWKCADGAAGRACGSFFLKRQQSSRALVTRNHSPDAPAPAPAPAPAAAVLGMTSRPLDRQWTVVCTWRTPCTVNGWVGKRFLALSQAIFNEFRKKLGGQKKMTFSYPQAAEFGQFLHVSLNFTLR